MKSNARGNEKMGVPEILNQHLIISHSELLDFELG